jgi:hypothetical protein
MRKLFVDISKRCIGEDNSLHPSLNRLLRFQARVSLAKFQKLIKVPSIVVEESETSLLSVPRAAMPSLDLTQMRNDMGTGYSPTRPAFSQEDRLQVQGISPSGSEDESESHPRSWSNLGAPDSQIATISTQSDLYLHLTRKYPSNE